MKNILDQIVETKHKEVEAAKARRPLSELSSEIARLDAPRDFAGAIAGPGSIQIIAEIKKASPSAGVILDAFDPVQIAQVYAEFGAAAISVLTDETYFQGRLSFIHAIKQAVALPVLRKDFIVDEYQIHESRTAEADAVLLIAEVLGAKRIAAWLPLCRELGMTALVEVHEEANLDAVLAELGQPSAETFILGINNRDLTVQRTDIATTARLAAKLDDGAPFVAESGISSRSDVLEVQRAGACAVLVGESLLRSADIGAKLSELLGSE